MACVPQFDTMHPSMSLDAFFNDREFYWLWHRRLFNIDAIGVVEQFSESVEK